MTVYLSLVKFTIRFYIMTLSQLCLSNNKLILNWFGN